MGTEVEVASCQLWKEPNHRGVISRKGSDEWSADAGKVMKRTRAFN